jgi:hypothetical protein
LVEHAVERFKSESWHFPKTVSMAKKTDDRLHISLVSNPAFVGPRCVVDIAPYDADVRAMIAHYHYRQIMAEIAVVPPRSSSDFSLVD